MIPRNNTFWLHRKSHFCRIQTGCQFVDKRYQVGLKFERYCFETSWLSIYSADKHSLPKKTLSFKKRHSWGREWKIEEVLPVQTSRFCELYWTFLKISVSLSREDKRGSHLGSLQKFCNIFFSRRYQTKAFSLMLFQWPCPWQFLH